MKWPVVTLLNIDSKNFQAGKFPEFPLKLRNFPNSVEIPQMLETWIFRGSGYFTLSVTTLGIHFHSFNQNCFPNSFRYRRWSWRRRESRWRRYNNSRRRRWVNRRRTSWLLTRKMLYKIPNLCWWRRFAVLARMGEFTFENVSSNWKQVFRNGRHHNDFAQ